MKNLKFIEVQIVFAFKQSETGVKVEEVCRKMGISETPVCLCCDRHMDKTVLGMAMSYQIGFEDEKDSPLGSVK